MANSTQLKSIASTFLNLCALGSSRKAFKKFTHPSFIHHNIHFKGDGTTLMLAIEENASKMPNELFEIRKMIEEDNQVMTFSYVKLANTSQEIAVMHIFRFENNKIIELWDMGQAIPPNAINENGMF